MLGLAFSLALARLLGADRTGLFFLAVAVATIASVFARAGVDSALLRFSATHASRSDWPGLAGVRRQGVVVVALTSLIAAAAVAVAAPWIAERLFREPALTPLVRLVALAVLPMSLLQVDIELLRGIGRIRDATAMQYLAPPLFGLPALFVLAPRLGAAGAVVAHVLAAMAVLVVARHLWRRATPQLRSLPGTFDRRRLMATALPLFWVASMDLVMGMTDTVMLGLWKSAEAVGIYGVALRTAALTAFALAAVNVVAAPKFAALFAHGDRRALSRVARDAARLTLFATLPLFLALVIVPAWILGLFGGEFRTGAWPLRLLAAGQFVNVVTGSVGYLLTMTGHEKLMRNNIVFCAFVNVALNALLIPPYGILGAAAATAISLAALNIISAVLVYRRLSIVTLPWPRPGRIHGD